MEHLQHAIADHLEENDFDGMVFEFRFSEGVLPVLYAIRRALGDKQLIVTTHPHICKVVNGFSLIF